MVIAAPQSLTFRLLVARPAVRVAILAVALGGFGSVALADCNADLGALMKKRMAEIGALNQISKANGGKLDPIAACPRLRSLAADEGQVVAYMTKNKDWCSLPDDLVSKMSASQVKTSGFAAKACTFAVKMKQAREQQAKGGGPQQEQAVKLPTGPL